jgi:hemoglobin
MTVLAFVVLVAPAVRAQEPAALPRAEVEAKIIGSLTQTIDIGVPMFNGGDQTGCLRLYEGALTAVVPLLDYRQDLSKSVQDKLARVRQPGGTPAEKAFALRGALDEIRTTLHRDQPLWSRLRGEPAVKAVVHDVVLAAAADPKVNFMRGKPLPDAAGIAKLEQSLVEFISSATGGPLKYNGKSMADAHAGMNITNEEFDALAGHLVATLKKFKVAQKEIDELVGIVSTTKKDIVGK